MLSGGSEEMCVTASRLEAKGDRFPVVSTVEVIFAVLAEGARGRVADIIHPMRRIGCCAIGV
jgi:hypothetical protein